MKKLNKVLRFLIYILPAVLFFSYYPVISFGANAAMNFELSLPLIWLLIFDLVAAVIFVMRRDFSFFKKWKWLLFPIFATVSLIWTTNLVRGVLTVGILWLVVFAIYAILHLREIFMAQRDFSYVFLRFFVFSALFVCAFCVLQCVLDVAGVSREATLLCQGCVYGMFGFPHPNGFAIEPQFMGNLLLAPAIVMIWLIMTGPDTHNLFRTAFVRSAGSRFLDSKFLLFSVAFILVVTLFLTFSRGAIYAFIVAMIFMSILYRPKRLIRDTLKGARPSLWSRIKRFRALLTVWLTIVLAFLFALNLQGILAAVSPTNDTYFSGVAKVVNHLSLGVVDIDGGDARGDGGAEDNADGNGERADGEKNDGEKNEAAFDGYVEESTNVRLELTQNAIKVWSRDFKTVMLGVGIGGAGQAMYDAGLTGTPKEIVQNEYASLLLEVGVVGVALAAWVLIMAVKMFVKMANGPMILTLMVAYGVSLLFFAGLANALHIYLLPAVLAMETHY